MKTHMPKAPPTREDERQQRRAGALRKLVAEGLGVPEDELVSGAHKRALDVFLVACRFDAVRLANIAKVLPGRSASVLAKVQLGALKDNEVRWLAQDIAARRLATVDDDDALLRLRESSNAAKSGELRPSWAGGAA